MPDLTPNSEQQNTEEKPSSKKALIFDDEAPKTKEKASIKDAKAKTVHINIDEGAKIISNPQKRWKLVGIITAVVVLLITIGFLINGQRTGTPITDTFTGNFPGMPGGPPGEPGPGHTGELLDCDDGQVPTEIAPGLVVCKGIEEPDEDPPAEPEKSDDNLDDNEAAECDAGEIWNDTLKVCEESQECLGTKVWDPVSESCIEPKTGGGGSFPVPGSNGSCPQGMKEKVIKLPGLPTTKTCVPEVVEEPDEDPPPVVPEECPDGQVWDVDIEACKIEVTEESCAAIGKDFQPTKVGGICVDPPEEQCAEDEEEVNVKGTIYCVPKEDPGPVINPEYCESQGLVFQPKKGGDECVEAEIKTPPLLDPPATDHPKCEETMNTIEAHENLLNLMKSRGEDPFVIEIVEFLLSENIRYAMMTLDCSNVPTKYRKAPDCNSYEMFNPDNNACKVRPGYKYFSAKYIADCESVDETIAAITTVFNRGGLTRNEQKTLANLSADLEAEKGFSCKEPESLICEEGTVPNEEGTECMIPMLCVVGTHLNEEGTECVPDQPEGLNCAEGLVPNDDNTDCVIPIIPKTEACVEIETKLSNYKNLISSDKNPSYSSMTSGEKAIIEYLLDYALRKAIEAECEYDSDYDAALNCSAKEMFNTKNDTCKAIPGYQTLGSGDKEVECSNLDNVIAAIDLKLLDSDLRDEEKALLATLKLDLTQYTGSCAATVTNNGNGSNIVASSGSGSSGGGGSVKTGGGGTPKNTKNFDVQNIQVKPESFNPFTQSVKVHFFLTHISRVSMEILDGAEIIETIEEQKMNAGDRFIVWDGRTENGGFVPEREYEYKLIVKKASNTKNFIQRKGFIGVEYFDANFELPLGATFEDFPGATGFPGSTGSVISEINGGTSHGAATSGTFGSTVGASSAGAISSGNSVHAPLTQNIHLEGQGKTITSEVGPERLVYLLFLIPIYFIARRPKEF